MVVAHSALPAENMLDREKKADFGRVEERNLAGAGTQAAAVGMEGLVQEAERTAGIE